MTLLVKLENLALGLLALYGYYQIDASWMMFALLILVPDVTFAGYIAGPKTGAICYNLAHNWMMPLCLLVIGYAIRDMLVAGIALIWCAHVGFDRAMGYGLKHFTGFKDTHLGRIGKA